MASAKQGGARRGGTKRATKVEVAETTTDHPRFTHGLVGHGDAEAAFLDAWTSGRLAHAWLISGPKGVGKATLAYRIARFVLAEGEGAGGGMLLGDDAAATGLDLSPEHPVSRRINAGAHGDLRVLERGIDDRGRQRGEITVGDARGLHPFLTQTAAEGGWRVAIIDAADEMNRNAANAVLKLLEEPPSKALLLLVSHSPGRLLPTIRSRCRHLRLSPLAIGEVEALLHERMPDLEPEKAALAARLSDGSPGRALNLAAAEGAWLYSEMVGALAALPALDVERLHKLGDGFQRPDGTNAFTTFVELLDWWMCRWIREAARGASPEEVVGGEGEVGRRLMAARALDQWIEVWEKVSARARQGLAVNLDRKQLLITMFADLAAAARGR